MAVLKKSEKHSEMLEVFSKSQADKSKIIIWQTDAEGQRVINFANFQSIEDENIHFASIDKEDFTLTGNDVFFYIDGANVIFKSIINSAKANVLDTKFPDALQFLDDTARVAMLAMLRGPGESVQAAPKKKIDPLADKLVIEGGGTEKIETTWMGKLTPEDRTKFDQHVDFVSIDAEDAQFEEERASPRGKAVEGKMITLQLTDESKPQNTFPLYDLSQGGFSFLVFTKDDFSEGQELSVKSFDITHFDVPIHATVRVVREADQLGIQYKVGCEFLG